MQTPSQSQQIQLVIPATTPAYQIKVLAESAGLRVIKIAPGKFKLEPKKGAAK